MASIASMVNCARHFLWGSSAIQSNPQSGPEAFKENLSKFSASAIDQDTCIANCCKSVKDVLQTSDCDLSEASLEEIKSYIDGFNIAVDDAPTLIGSDNLKNAFKKSLCEVVEEKWAVVMAQAFHPIPSIPVQEKQIAAAQKWAQQFFAGVDYFNQWEGFFTCIQGEFVAKLQQKTSSAFSTYSYEVIQEKMKVIQTQAEKYPISFGKLMDQAAARAKKDPNSLSPEDLKYLDYAQILAHCVTGYWPDVEQAKELLKACVWNTFTLREVKSSVDSDVGFNLFARMFTKA